MNTYILILIIVSIFLYYNYLKVFNYKFYTKNYILGIIDNNNIVNISNNLIELYKNKYSEEITIKKYTNNKKLLEDLNNNTIQLGINVENNVIDSVLGLNSYKKKPLTNINFCSGLYYNFYYFLTNIFYKNTAKTIKVDSVKDIKTFYDIYGRNFIIGTDNMSSLSFMGLMMILYIYEFIPINITKIDNKKKNNYGKKHIFYYNDTVENLELKMNNKEIDGLFLVRSYDEKNIKNIVSESEVIFLNMFFKNTVFDKLFSNYFFKKKISINNFYDNDDIININGTFETRSNRVLLISNNMFDTNITEKIVKIYYENNFFLINKLRNIEETKLYQNHYLFDLLEMAYINKQIPMNKGANNYYITNGYITKSIKNNNSKKLQYYWKYKKIGLTEFEL